MNLKYLDIMIQKVIRTYPADWFVSGKTTNDLEDVLKEGYKVIMCTPIPLDTKGHVANEYIVQKGT